MAANETLNLESLRSRLVARVDTILDRIYNYHGNYVGPREVIRDVWAAPAALLEGAGEIREYFLHYFQSQGLGPTRNECVTTSTVMGMNMMEDRIAASLHRAPLQLEANLCIEDFIHDLEGLGLRGWKFRFPTHSPLPGMMPPWGARNALRAHAASLRKKYGRGYRIQTRSHQTVDDLVQALEQNKVILLHGAWEKKLTDSTDRFLALLGGMPHTMLLVGYEAATGIWNLLNPAEPWVTSRSQPYRPRLFRMNTRQLLDFWGRRFLFYPPRFAITTLTMEE